MRALLRRHVTLSLLSLIASPAWADEAPGSTSGDAAVARRAAEVGTEQAGRVLSDGSPNSRAAAGYSASKIEFTQEGGETSVSMAFSLDLTSYRKPQSPGDYYKFSQTKLTVVGTAPIEKGSKDAPLFASDSLVSGTKLKFSVVGFTTNVGTGKGGDAEFALSYRRCIAQATGKWVELQPDRVKAASEAAALTALIEPGLIGSRGQRPNFDGVMETAATSGDLGLVVTKECYPGQDDGKLADEYDLVKAYGDDPKTFARRFLPDNAKLTFWGLDGSVGQDDYTVLDQTAFKLETKPRTSWEVGGFYGLISSDLSFSLRGRLVYGQTYKDQDELEICRTVSIPAGTECIKGPNGDPVRQRTGLASLEARKLIKINDGTEIGIAPQVTYRFKDKNVGVEVPIYLSPDKDGKLTGGIKAVYNSKGDEFAVGLFVGVPFSIFYD